MIGKLMPYEVKTKNEDLLFEKL